MPPKLSAKPSVRKKVRKKHPKRSTNSWLAAGFDISMSSVAGAAFGYDATLNEYKGPEFTIERWGRNTHYFDRISSCSRAENFIHDLQSEMGMTVKAEDIYIAIEEPWPMGMVGKQQSNSLKQQAEISGAFLAGLLRYGYKNIFQIHNTHWRQIVAADLGITIHYSKWDKWKPKEWALAMEIEDWPDLINHSTKGKIPRPEGSKAKAVQPDDRYDAFAIATWMRREVVKAPA